MTKCRNGRETDDVYERDSSSDDDGVDIIKGKWYRGVITSDVGNYDVEYADSITEERERESLITASPNISGDDYAVIILARHRLVVSEIS